MDDFEAMRLALSLAREAASEGEIPVGAVLLDRTSGEILGQGRNRRETDHSPIAHAEILAIEEAAQRRQSWRLSGTTLYVTLEPCPMCGGAILAARIDRLVFGAYDEKSGAIVSVQQMFQLPYNHHPRVTAGLLEDECAAVLQSFFSNIR